MHVVTDVLLSEFDKATEWRHTKPCLAQCLSCQRIENHIYTSATGHTLNTSSKAMVSTVENMVLSDTKVRNKRTITSYLENSVNDHI